MKNNIFVMGVLLAAALSFIGCVKDASVAQVTEGVPYTIKADLSDTKTVNDGVSTKWKSGDALSVFHAVAGGEDYVSDGKFTVSSTDPEAGVFTGELAGTLDAPEYDWYAIYPYSANRTTPASQTVSYSIIGSSSGQTQTGYGDMSHISGGKSPLYGVAKAVSGSELPVMNMKYLASLVRIRVVNNSSDPLVITSAEFSAPEEIVGSFYIDIAQETPVYKARSVTTAKSTAALSVTDGGNLVKGSSADLYMLIKPFTAEKGETLTLTVNNIKRTLTVADDVEFHAGKIKTLEFVINEGDIKDPSEYNNPDGKQWFFTMYTGGFHDEAHRTVGVVDLGVVAAGKCTCAVQCPDPAGRIMWGSIFNNVEFDYEITPYDDESGIITLTEMGVSFSYSGLAGNTMVLEDEWGVYGAEGASYECEAGLYNVTSYFNQYGGM